MHSDDTYDVKYDDGDAERRIRRSHIRLLKKSQRKLREKRDGTVPGTIFHGDRIEARFRGKAKWYRGKVVRVNDDETFDVEYDDGDVEQKSKNVVYKESQR